MKELISSGKGFLKTYNHITENYWYDFLYVTNTYSGYLMTYVKRLKGDEDDIIQRLKKFFIKNLCYENNIPIIVLKSYQQDYPEILETRVCMTKIITKDYKQIGVIWFDDGKISTQESLLNIFDKIDWTKAQEFDY